MIHTSQNRTKRSGKLMDFVTCMYRPEKLLLLSGAVASFLTGSPSVFSKERPPKHSSATNGATESENNIRQRCDKMGRT